MNKQNEQVCVNLKATNHMMGKEQLFSLLLAMIVVFAMSIISPAYAAPASDPKAAALATSLNSGVAKDLIQASASGNTVTVTTKSASTAAPHLEIDIPAGVIVVWKAQYVNDDFVPIPTDVYPGDRDVYYTGDCALIYLTGSGLFSIQSEANISITEGAACASYYIEAIHSGESPTNPGTGIEVTGGSVSVTGTKSDTVTVAITLEYASTAHPAFSISGGSVSVVGVNINEGTYGVVVGNSDNAVVNITGGTVAATGDGSVPSVAILVTQSADTVATMTGGRLLASGSAGTSTSVGLITDGDVTMTGGIIYTKNQTAGGVFCENKLVIGDDAAIFAVGGTSVDYQSISGPEDISKTYANVQMTALAFASGTAATIAVGDTYQLIPATTPAERTYRFFTWTSSDPSIATVDSNGTIVGVSLGTATITATSLDLTDTTATFELTVGADLTVLKDFGIWSGSGTSTAKIDAPLSTFRSLSIQGTTLDPRNYDVSEGSTVITLHEDYLGTLAAGNYNLVATFGVGTVNLHLQVDPAAPATGDSGSVLPATGDSLAGVLAIAGLSALVGVSLLACRRGNKLRNR